jgi:hypothetical protein
MEGARLGSCTAAASGSICPRHVRASDTVLQSKIVRGECPPPHTHVACACAPRCTTRAAHEPSSGARCTWSTVQSVRVQSVRIGAERAHQRPSRGTPRRRMCVVDAAVRDAGHVTAAAAEAEGCGRSVMVAVGAESIGGMETEMESFKEKGGKEKEGGGETVEAVGAARERGPRA